MNAKQAEVISSFQHDILEHDGHSTSHIDGKPSQYEYKRFEVDECEGRNTVYLYTEVGRIGDEGTMAEALARTTRHIAIGKQGGVRLLNPATYHHGKMHWVHYYINGYRRALTSLTK